MAEELDEQTLAFAHQMFDLAREGCADELAAYLDAGLPPDLTNAKGDTLLILAAYHARPGTVAALLERHADPARTNDRGQTALAAGVFRRSAEVVAALLQAGVKVGGQLVGTPLARQVEHLVRERERLLVQLLGHPPSLGPTPGSCSRPRR